LLDHPHRPGHRRIVNGSRLSRKNIGHRTLPRMSRAPRTAQASRAPEECSQRELSSATIPAPS
jgi:hypothetical protein